MRRKRQHSGVWRAVILVVDVVSDFFDIPFYQCHRCTGRIVAVAHAGRGCAFARKQRAAHRRSHIARPHHHGNLLGRYGPRAQNGGCFARHIHHSGFNANRAFAAVYDHGDDAAKVLHHVCSQRGAGAAGQISAGRGQRQSGLRNQPYGYGVIREAHAHGGQACGDDLGHTGLSGQQHR